MEAKEPLLPGKASDCGVTAKDNRLFVEAIRNEFERLLPVIKSGRFIPSVDHQTPPAVSMKDYAIYRRLLDDYTTSIER
jgi:hypothetical protein